MNFYRNKIKAIVVFMGLVTTIFTGCSDYGKIASENSKNPQNNSTPNNAVGNNVSKENTDSDNNNKNIESTPDTPPPPVVEEEAYNIGDNVIRYTPIGDMQYCVKKAEVFTNITEVGLEIPYDSDKDVVNADGTLKDNNIFIQLIVEVTNISEVNEGDDNSIGNLRIKSSAPARNPDPNLPLDFAYYLRYMYFLNSEYAFNAADYFHYKIAIGETKELKLGWIVNLDEFDKSNLFLSIPTAVSDEVLCINLGL